MKMSCACCNKTNGESGTGGPYGHRLICPNCGDTEFFIYRSNMYGKDDELQQLREIAECKRCNCSTYTHALKTKYHDIDKSKDFKIAWKEKQRLTFVCPYQECDEKYKDTTQLYEQTFYENTLYSDINPEPAIDWNCPKKTILAS